MTRIKLGVRPGAWFDGSTFSTKEGQPLDEHTLDEVALDLCRRLFNFPRWQGETNAAGECVSVGDHSILVGRRARDLALARGLSDEVAELAYRLGFAHDLGETLGLGDPASPFLAELPETKARSKQHQRAAESLFTVERDVTAARQAVHSADALAAVLERRFHFGDHSGDCESEAGLAAAEELVGAARGVGANLGALFYAWPSSWLKGPEIKERRARYLYRVIFEPLPPRS